MSPPPRMTTRLPVGEDLARDACRRRRPCSAAAGSPWRSGCPAARGRGPGRSRGLVAPLDEHDGVEVAAQLRRRCTSTPTCDAGAEGHALGRHLLHAAVDEPLLHLEVGDAVAQQPADPVGALEERDRVPGARELLRAGHAGGPRADDGDLLAGAPLAAAAGATQPSAKAWSMMFFSMFLMVTGSSLMLRTHASSHGAGQMRPVNSGKLLVECRRSIASRQRPRYTRSFQSGMMFPSGQPLWQKGMPQSMQRAPCARSSSSGVFSSNSRQCLRRCGDGLLVRPSRARTRGIR